VSHSGKRRNGMGGDEDAAGRAGDAGGGMTDEGNKWGLPTDEELEEWLARSPEAQQALMELQAQHNPSPDDYRAWRRDMLLHLWTMGGCSGQGA
jgi:hypothetical protein